MDAREAGVAERSGLLVEEHFAHAFKVADEKVVEWRMLGPVAQALDSLGVRE
jgi:hypothetical protein